ncbi:MAG: cellulase family glycosylhydrolase [Chloroflexota bacterium]|nr:cellulase family glycosylhydrolase [Chloroflexota bacterium]
MSKPRFISRVRFVISLAILFSLLPQVAAPPATADVAATPLPNRSFFGMNLYVTGLERSKEERLTVLNSATDLGVKWSREEMSWANLEPYEKGVYNWKAYDPWIDELVKRDIDVIGAIQTSPAWASGIEQGSVPDWYWYTPQNPQDFVDFARVAAEHYKGKIDVWEIWNEQDVEMTFKCHGCDRVKVYAEMLAGSYAAIKQVNPEATVLVGGLSIHDRTNAGMAFLEQVVAASGGKLNFDVLSIHPYMPDRHPESTDPRAVVQNFPYRLEMSRKWLQDHGAPNKEIWVTETGYSTCNPCGNLGVSEEEQARRLVRLYALAMAAPNVTHFTYFQIKDKFNHPPGDMFGNMAIMRNDMSQKPAYVAYRVMAHTLEGATFTGQGPLMRAVQNRWQPQFDRYHYRFTRAGKNISVIWKLGQPETATMPLTQRSAEVVSSRGEKLDVQIHNNAITLRISEDPIYVVESNPTSSTALDPAVDTASPTGFRASLRFQPYWQNNGGLPLFGYPISGERNETNPIDGKQYIVQWFERARFEYHPEHAGTPYEVQLGLLGVEFLKGRTFPPIAPPRGVEAQCFRETGHCIWGKFLERWRKLGLAVVGLPLSDQFEERSTDGKTYIVQYFERERFEYHPENQPPYDVLLGLLGRQLYKP